MSNYLFGTKKDLYPWLELSRCA